MDGGLGPESTWPVTLRPCYQGHMDMALNAVTQAQGLSAPLH